MHYLLSRVGLLPALCVFAGAGCGLQPEASVMPSTLRVGVLPDQAPADLRARHEPLCAYLGQELGVPHALIIPDSYGDLVELFHQGRIDLAYFGGYTFVQVLQAGGADPIAMRNADGRFTSYFLVRADASGTTLEDFRGRTFAFGSRLSTSGHLMPRHFLNQQHIVPERFFSEVRYSGAHDRTAEWVRDGVVDVGAANSLIVREMFADRLLPENRVRVLVETPPYPDYVWAAHPRVAPAFRDRIRQALLNLSTDNLAHAAILRAERARGFLPAGVRDFDQLLDAVAAMPRVEPDEDA